MKRLNITVRKDFNTKKSMILNKFVSAVGECDVGQVNVSTIRVITLFIFHVYDPMSLSED